MATREQLIEDFADHKYATGEKFARLINSMKVVQEPVADPAASGTSLSFIDSIEQDADGKITATKKTLDLSNAHELNPFKGWWKTGDTLPTSGFDGAYLYFKDTTQTPAVTTIYQWNGTTYAPTGTVVDESNVQTFGSGQAVNEVKVKDENGEEVTGPAGVLSAEAGKRLGEGINGLTHELRVIQTTYSSIGTIGSDGETITASNYNRATDYIELSEYSYLRLTSILNNVVVVFYDANKSIIGYKSKSDFGVSDILWHTVKVPIAEGAVYCRFNVYVTSDGIGANVGKCSCIEGAVEVVDAVDDVKESLDSYSSYIGESEAGEIDMKLSGYIKIDGTVGSSTFSKYSDFVKIDHGLDYYVKSYLSHSYAIGYYSEAIEGSVVAVQPYMVTSHSVHTIKLAIPDGAVYMRASMNINGDGIGFFWKKKVLPTTSMVGIEDVLNEYKEVLCETTYTPGLIDENGNVASSTYAKHSDYIPVDVHNKYYAYTKLSTFWYIGYYSEANENSFVSSEHYNQNSGGSLVRFELTIPSDAAYMRVTLNNGNSSGVIIGTKAMVHRNIPQSLKPKEYRILLDGSGDFSGLVEACTALKNDLSEKVIYMEGGTYDIYDEMGGDDYVANIPSDVEPDEWVKYSNIIPSNTKLVGLGMVTLNFLPPDTIPEAKMKVINPISVRGSVEIENFTINARNCRYCIHDENSGGWYMSRKVYKNVRLNKSGGGFGQAFGCGFSKNNTFVFEDCLFSSNSSPVWSVHDSDPGGNTSIRIVNSVFVANVQNFIAVRFGTLINAPSAVVDAKIINSKLGGRILLDDATQRLNRYQLLLVGSGNPDVITTSGNNPQEVLVIE